jgi:hypothetical protein
MTNILTITLGSFKLDVPLDSLTKLSATPAATAPTPTLVKKVEAPKQTTLAIKPFAMPVITQQEPPRPRNKNASAYTRFARDLIRSMNLKDSAFLAYPEDAPPKKESPRREAQKIALRAAAELRESGYTCYITTGQKQENGVEGVRIWRLR